MTIISIEGAYFLYRHLQWSFYTLSRWQYAGENPGFVTRHVAKGLPTRASDRVLTKGIVPGVSKIVDACLSGLLVNCYIIGK